MASLAATRSAFVYTIYDTCLYYYCYKKRDTGLTERDIATYGYLDTMSAAAGLSGLEMYGSLHHLACSSQLQNTS